MDINGSSEIGNHIILMGNPRGAADTHDEERSRIRSYLYTIIVGKNCYGAIRHYIQVSHELRSLLRESVP